MGVGGRDEQHGRDRLDAVRAGKVVAYCTRVVLDREMAAKGLPVMCNDRVRYCKGRLEKNDRCVKTETVSARQAGKDDEQAPELDDLFFTLSQAAVLPRRQIPNPRQRSLSCK